MWALIVLVLSSLPGGEVNKLPFLDKLYIDKLAHIFMYALLSFLLSDAFSAYKKNPLSLYILYTMIIAVFYGVFIEIMQQFVFVERSAEFFDIIANAFGAAAGGLIFFLFRKNQFKQS